MVFMRWPIWLRMFVWECMAEGLFGCAKSDPLADSLRYSTFRLDVGEDGEPMIDREMGTMLQRKYLTEGVA